MADDNERKMAAPDEALEDLRQELDDGEDDEDGDDEEVDGNWLELQLRRFELERRVRRCVRCDVQVGSDGQATADRGWCCVPCWPHYAN